MWDRVRQFRKLDGRARRVFWRAAALLPLLSASLRLRGFRKTQEFLQRHVSSTTGQFKSSIVSEAQMSARMVRAAARNGIGHPSCLEESLALWWLLGRRGIASDLRVGVRKSRERMEAHAWVECAGAALNEPEDAHRHFAAFDAALSSLPQEQQ